jgi:hypothetical protein
MAIALRYEDVCTVGVPSRVPLLLSSALTGSSRSFVSGWQESLLNALTDSRAESPSRAEALYWATEFIRQLPSDTAAPTLEFEPDGDIAFDWDCGTRSTFSVSVTPDGKLKYGGLFGTATRYGSETLTSSISPEILRCIWRATNRTGA